MGADTKLVDISMEFAIFYRKLPFYDLSSHTYKGIRETKNRAGKCYTGGAGTNDFDKPSVVGKYTPSLPNSIIVEDDAEDVIDIGGNTIKTHLYSNTPDGKPRELYRTPSGQYDPPLPNTTLEIKSQKGK